MEMEVDTGAAVSILSDAVRKSNFPELKLQKSSIILRTYTKEQMEVLRNLDVTVTYGSQEAKLSLVDGDRPSLFGHNWLENIRMANRDISQKSLTFILQQQKYPFANELGTVEPYRIKLLVKPDATPIFKPPRLVSFAIRLAIGQELNRLDKKGIVTKVTHSEWAAPLVAVHKKDGKFRLCGDYKVTANKVLSVDQYPLPKLQDIYATLAGGTLYSKLDLSQAHLHDESTKYVTVNTHQGLYRYKRLP